MQREARFEASLSSAGPVAGKACEAGAAERESTEGSELSSRTCPARGILNAVIIGAGAWIIILGTVALARAIFFG